jgi:hypothetical protein
MRVLAFMMILAFSAFAGERSRMISIKKFEIAPPASGTYAPWRDRNDSSKWYAGELITVSESTFRYTRFSDSINPDRPQPDYSGKISIFKDHIHLDHPGIAYPYRVSGLADGLPVLLTWEGYEQWKKEKMVFALNLLYLEKTPKQKK